MCSPAEPGPDRAGPMGGNRMDSQRALLEETAWMEETAWTRSSRCYATGKDCKRAAGNV
jgi:hypothetical protein